MSEFEEIWKPIPNFPGYYASNKGRIEGPKKMLSPGNNGKYLLVQLWKEGKQFTKAVHVAVCEAFHGLKPSELHMALHRDDDHLHNTPDNLYWGTKQDNGIDSRENGRNAQTKLDWIKVREIRRLHKAGTRPSVLARQFEVSQPNINQIVNNKTWIESDSHPAIKGELSVGV